MNYLKIYCSLIRKTENRTPPEGYTEKHHIFPVSIFGKNNKVVTLTAREHYLAHALLEKAFIKRYGIDHWKTKKMINAHIAMKANRNYWNSILYENSKIRFSRSKLGIPRSEETKKRISKSRTGKKYNPLTEEHKIKIGLPKKGKPRSQEVKDKIRKTRELRNLNGRTYLIKNPKGDIFITNNLNKFCLENNLSQSNMSSILNPNHRAKTHRGWTIEYINSSCREGGMPVPTLDVTK